MMQNRFLYYFFILDIFILDQVSKWFVSEQILKKTGSLGLVEWVFSAPERMDFVSIKVLPFFNFVMVWNKGISFGLFNQESDIGPLLLTIFSSIIAIGFLVWLSKVQNNLQRIAIVLVCGGAIANIFDRLRFGAVMDFLDVHAFGYHWPAFNVADSCIVVGVILLMTHAFFFEKSLHKSV